MKAHKNPSPASRNIPIISHFKKFVKTFLILTLVFLLAVPITATVAALDEDTFIKFAENNILFYDPFANNCIPGGVGSGGMVVVTGDEPMEMVWNGFMSTGLFTPEQAAGIIGNLISESASPTKNEYGKAFGKGGYGIAQWTNPGRRDNFVAAFKAAGFEKYYNETYNVDIDTLRTMITKEELAALYAFQIEYIITELQGRTPRPRSSDSSSIISVISTFPSGSSELAVIQQISDVALVAEFILFSFERPGSTLTSYGATPASYTGARSTRASHGANILARFGHLGGSPGGGGGGVAGSTVFLSPGHGSNVSSNTIGLGGLVYGSSSANANEISNMLTVAQRLRVKLEADGYTVVLARESNNTNPSVSERAQMARDAGAAIGIAIHSDTSTNEVWYQEIGRYRENNPQYSGTFPSGTNVNARVTFGSGQLGIPAETAQQTATLSQQYATAIANARSAAEGGRSVSTRGNLSGLFMPSNNRNMTTKGDTALEMLFPEDIPWVYNEFANHDPLRDNNMTDLQINQYVEGLYNGIIGLNLSSSPRTDNCLDPGGYANIAETARALAQPKGANAAPDNPTAAYQHWFQELGQWTGTVGGSFCGGYLGFGASCDRFAATVLFAAGVITKEEALSMLTVDLQAAYFRRNPDKWQEIGKFGSEADLKPGDVLANPTIGSRHVAIYLGNGEVAHASCSSKNGKTGRVTDLQQRFFNGSFLAFRYRG